jgi:hypothetical protein
LPRIDQEMFLALTPTGGEDAASTAGQEAGATSRDGHDAKDIMRSWGLILRKGNRNPSPWFSGTREGEIRSLGGGRRGGCLPRWVLGAARVEAR